MPKLKYTIDIASQEKALLKKIVTQGKASARTILHANILIKSDIHNEVKLTVREIAAQCNTSATTVIKVRTAYSERGFDAALYRKKRTVPPVPPKIDGSLEAHVIALACSEPPEGHARWTLHLLADKSVKLGYAEELSHTTVHKILKKTNFTLT